MKYEPSVPGSQELQQGHEVRGLGFAAAAALKRHQELLQKHISGEEAQALSGPAVRRLVFNKALLHEEEAASDPETVGPAAPCWDSPPNANSPHSSAPPSPERVTQFVRPNPEVLARMSQGERGAGGRALRAKAYWERRFAPLKRLEEASSLLRAGIRNASAIAEHAARASNGATSSAQASSSSSSAPASSAPILGLFHKPSAMGASAVCEAAGSGPCGEKGEAEHTASFDSASYKCEDAEG